MIFFYTYKNYKSKFIFQNAFAIYKNTTPGFFWDILMGFKKLPETILIIYYYISRQNG